MLNPVKTGESQVAGTGRPPVFPGNNVIDLERQPAVIPMKLAKLAAIAGAAPDESRQFFVHVLSDLTALLEGKAGFGSDQVKETADTDIAVQLVPVGLIESAVLVLDDKLVHSFAVRGSEVKLQKCAGSRRRKIVLIGLNDSG